MKAFGATATDTIRVFHPRWGVEWTPKRLEVMEKRFIVDKSEDTPRLAVELDVAETGRISSTGRQPKSSRRPDISEYQTPASL